MTVKLLTLKPKQDVIADIEEIRTGDPPGELIDIATQLAFFKENAFLISSS